MVGPLALSLPLSAKLAVRMPTVKANMNAAAATIMPLVIMEAPKLLGHSASIAVYSTVACDARHKFGEYVVEHAEHVSRRASLARLVPWDRVGTSRRLDVPQSAPKAPARPGLSFTPLCSDWDYEEFIGAKKQLRHTSLVCPKNDGVLEE